jgi:hypothetical protein
MDRLKRTLASPADTERLLFIIQIHLIHLWVVAAVDVARQSTATCPSYLQRIFSTTIEVKPRKSVRAPYEADYVSDIWVTLHKEMYREWQRRKNSRL